MALVIVAIALATAVLADDSLDCVKFRSDGHLRAGAAFAAKLPGGLEFRLVPDAHDSWSIEVVDPATPGTDYVWVVSPPYQTAPQRMIGHGYGLTVRESASFERKLRFVLNAADHQRMFDAHSSRLPTQELIALREGLTLGQLSLKITGFGLRRVALPTGEPGDGFAWITFEGEACVPR